MSFHRFLLASVALLLLATAAPAQTLYLVDGPGGTFDEITGPPDPALCNDPNGPLVGSLPFLVGGPCPPPAPYPPALSGFMQWVVQQPAGGWQATLGHGADARAAVSRRFSLEEVSRGGLRAAAHACVGRGGAVGRAGR